MNQTLGPALWNREEANRVLCSRVILAEELRVGDRQLSWLLGWCKGHCRCLLWWRSWGSQHKGARSWILWDSRHLVEYGSQGWEALCAGCWVAMGVGGRWCAGVGCRVHGRSGQNMLNALAWNKEKVWVAVWHGSCCVFLNRVPLQGRATVLFLTISHCHPRDRPQNYCWAVDFLPRTMQGTHNDEVTPGAACNMKYVCGHCVYLEQY